MGSKFVIDVVSKIDADELLNLDNDIQNNDSNTFGETKGKPYSFWITDKKFINTWKQYADASDMKIGTLITNAVNEYIENHPLTAEQKVAYKDRLLKQISLI